MTPKALLAELRAAGITLALTPEGRFRATGVDDGRLSPRLEAQIQANREALMALLEPDAGPSTTDSPPAADSPPRPRATSRPARKNRRPPQPPVAAPLLSSVSLGEPRPAPSLGSVEPLAALDPPALDSERRRGLRRSRAGASLSEPPAAAARAPVADHGQTDWSEGIKATIVVLPIVLVAAWLIHGRYGHAEQAEIWPASSRYDPWGSIDGAFPGTWPGR